MGISDDRATFEAALNAHRRIVLSVANAYCRDRSSRDDAVQNIAIELWRAYPRYDNRLPFSTWMYRIAVNAAISFYRRERKYAPPADNAEAGSLQAQSLGIDDEQPDVRRTTLYRLIDGLDELHRALVLLYLDDNSYAEIAAVLGVTETNVATKLSRIKQRFRRDIAADPPSS